MAHPAGQLHLASGSPRRREILSALGLSFTYGGADVDESRLPGESPGVMVVRLARAKAQAATTDARVTVAADTVVVLGDRIFGKPRSEEEAVGMLLALAGRCHVVLTGVAVRSGLEVSTVMSRSEVRFRDIDPEEAAKYWQSGEPRDKAGSYAIQGIGGVFVADLRGSYSGVVGLPVFETVQLLGAAGIDVLQGAGVES